MSRHAGPPRKVIVGATKHAMWGEYPGLEARLAELGVLIDEMAARAAEKYPGAGLDIVALPEAAVNGGLNGSAEKVSFPLDGPVLAAMAAKARQHNCYVVAPMFLCETALSGGRIGDYTNVAVLLDRAGEVAGIYRKVHAVSGRDAVELEGGVTPGTDFPVFQCDFGTLGLQICFDIVYEDGWRALADKGAELVIWPTQSPGQLKPAVKAMQHSYYILSSTWRNNASLIDPTGHVVREIRDGDRRVFVEQIDLSYALIGWQPQLGNGKAFDDAYGDRAGYRYSEAEDGGIFWSNDPATPIMKMVEELDLRLMAGEVERNRRLQDQVRGGPPNLK